MPIHSTIHIIYHDRLARATASARVLLSALVAMIALFSASEPAEADMRLLMFEEAGCVWCARWNADVGGEYPITPEGRAAPLTRLQLRDPLPEDISLVSRPRYTPTFVVVSDGEEIGRIEGYPGEDFFWGLLGRILEREAPNG
jgi:hypothetical protein